MRYFVLLLLPFTLVAKSWELVWQDEFDGPEINEAYWSWDTDGNAWDWGNNEDQHYTSKRSENSRIAEGKLIIEARKEAMGGKEYTSARLRTYKKASWLYGKIEIRAKLPGGKGAWPALWMLPEDDIYGGWPNSGEIDIMEYVGYNPDTLYSTVHTEAYNHDINTHKGGKIEMAHITDSFHVYRLEWFPDSMSFYVDSVHVFTFTPEGKDPAKWPFHKPFHLLMNVAVGGDWGGLQGIDDAIFPIQMVVDYVRAYREIDTPVKVDVMSHGEGTVALSPAKETYTIGETITLTATPTAGKEFLSWNGALTSKENPLQWVVTGHASFGATFRTAGELLKNGDFADAMDNWSFHKSSGEATATASDTGMVIAITESGTNAWDLQFEQKKLALVKGKKYTVTVELSSSDSLEFTLGVGMGTSPWKNYLSKKVIVNKEKTTITHSFTMTEDDPEGRIYLDLGLSKGTMTMHSISLKESSGSSIIKPSGKKHTGLGKVQLRDRVLVFSQQLPTQSSFSLVDTQGRTLMTRNTISPGAQIVLSAATIASGIYFVLLRSGAGVQREKIVVR